MPIGRWERLSQAAERWGLLPLLERLSRPRALIVLNYHRVGDPADCPYDRGVFDATVEQFEEHVASLRARYHMARLEEVREIIRSGARLRHTHVLLTFDDGYLDHYQTVFPILKSHGVQGTFFLPTSFVGTDHLPWWDQIAWLVRQAKGPEIVLRYPQQVSFHLPVLGTETVISRLLALYKHPATTDVAGFLAGLSEGCGAPIPQRAADRMFLTWDEAAEMARHGMAFGSHTHLHELLAKLPESQQQEEVVRSRELVQGRLSVEVSAIAYPVGARDSFSALTQKVVEKAGYAMGFSYYGGVNVPGRLQPFDLCRLPVDPTMSLPHLRLRMAVAAGTGQYGPGWSEAAS